MNCDQASDILLDADLSVLSADGESEVSRHLAQCDRCRAAADRILEQQRQLAETLRIEPRVPVEVALAAAARRSRTRRRVHALRWLAPLAAAAALVMMVYPGNRGATFSKLERPVSREPSLAIDLGIVTDQNVVVFETTTRPEVVVVWFY